MRCIKFIILFVIIGQSLFGQKTYISGKIQNSKSDSIGIILRSPLEANRTIKSPIKKGIFSITFSISIPTPAFLITPEKLLEMYIFPSDSISITFDEGNVIKTLKYQGTRSDEYNYFIKYRQTFNLPYGMFTKPDWSDIFEMDPVAFKKYRKDKVKTDLDFFDNYCTQNNVSEEFKIYAKAEIEYSYYYALMSYQSLRQYFKKIQSTLPADFYDDISIDLFQMHKNIVSQNYAEALKAYIYKYKIGNNKSTNEFYPLAYNLAQKNYHDTSLYCLDAMLLKDMFISDIKKNILDSIYNAFINTCTNPVYLDFVKASYYAMRNIKNVFPGDVLSTSLISPNGDKLLFKDFLSANKGKVIYIDVWASFCGPCRIEMPYSIDLQKKYSNNKNVKFVYLSIDSKVDAWKKAMESLQMTSDNFMIENGLNSKLCQYLNIYGIPHYILLNQRGEIVLPSASRPGAKSAETSIDELLK